MGKVLCLPQAEFNNLGIKTGFTYDNDLCWKIVENSKLEFIEREKAELDPSWKQIIPYVVVEPWEKFNHVFAYQRTKQGAEGRLHGNYSIGVGGHIDEEDMEYVIARNDEEAFRATFCEAVYRELDEELSLFRSCFNFTLMGALYDDSNEVGRVHLGIVVKLLTNEEEVRPEGQMANAKFYQKNELKNLTPWENWSKILLEHI